MGEEAAASLSHTNSSSQWECSQKRQINNREPIDKPNQEGRKKIKYEVNSGGHGGKGWTLNFHHLSHSQSTQWILMGRYCDLCETTTVSLSFFFLGFSLLINLWWSVDGDSPWGRATTKWQKNIKRQTKK